MNYDDDYYKSLKALNDGLKKDCKELDRMLEEAKKLLEDTRKSLKID